MLGKANVVTRRFSREKLLARKLLIVNDAPSNSLAEPVATDPLEVLRRYFGYESFRDPQEAIIRRTLAGQHSLVIMPTGSGKSLCYQIPALICSSTPSPELRPLTLVLSPLIALMKDQVDALKSRQIDAAYINSSLTSEQRQRRYQDVSAGRYQLLYVTPERFRKPEFLNVIAHRTITLLAVDEAHCISEWGHDFRPDYTRLREFRERLGNPTTIALTATATREVRADIIHQLGLPDETAVFLEGIDRPNLQLGVREVWGDDDKLKQIQEIRDRYATDSGSGIVYFTLIRTLERFSDLLRQRRVPHVCYHGDLERRQRRRIQNEFMRGDCPLVLATNAFGMGIDKQDIRYVIHAEIPGSMESWYQEIGRAGRDGRSADCVLLYDEADLTTQMEFIRWSNPDAQFYERVYDQLEHSREQLNAFGLEWLREKLHAKQIHDRRLESALAMLERYGAIEGTWEPMQLTVTGPLPPELANAERLQSKLRRDQQKLLSLVQFIRTEEDRRDFLRGYFG